ncbi:MAG: hypothetical protein WC291_03700, partial [Thermodesulfovibrionales bacterium]
MADEQKYKVPSLTEDWESKRQQWLKQSEGAISAAESPSAEPRGIWGAPLAQAPKSWVDNIFVRAMHPVIGVIGGVRDILGGRTLDTIFQELPEATVQRAKDEATLAVDQAARAMSMTGLYESLPLVPTLTGINSFEEYQETFAFDTSVLTPQDMQEARTAVEQAISSRTVAQPTEIPDWLQVSEEKEQAIKGFLVQPEATRTPLSLSMMTVEEVKKALHATPMMNIPPDMTMEEMLQLMSVMGVPAETLNEVVDIDAAVKILRDAALEQSQMIAEVKAGLREWEPPDQTFWQKAFFMVQSPMQQFADFLQPYINNVSYPMAGGAMRIVQGFIEGEQEAEKLYNKAREEGKNPWTAARESYVEWDAPWWQKLLIEIFTDPLTYVGTPVLGGVGVGLRKAGLGFIGNRLIALNKGFYAITDIPFDLWKDVVAKSWLPKTTAQIVTKEIDQFNGLLRMAVERNTGKLMTKATPDDIAAALKECIEEYAKLPGAADIQTTAKLGEMLSEHAALTDAKVWSWSAKHEGQLARDFASSAVPELAVSEVNQILAQATAKRLKPQEAAAALAQALGIERSADNLATLTREIPVFTKGLANNIDVALRVGKGASYNQVQKMVEFLNAKQKAIVLAREAGKQSKGGFLEGLALGMQRTVDKIENHRI